jgi:hypothetical protein
MATFGVQQHVQVEGTKDAERLSGESEEEVGIVHVWCLAQHWLWFELQPSQNGANSDMPGFPFVVCAGVFALAMLEKWVFLQARRGVVGKEALK